MFNEVAFYEVKNYKKADFERLVQEAIIFYKTFPEVKLAYCIKGLSYDKVQNEKLDYEKYASLTKVHSPYAVILVFKDKKAYESIIKLGIAKFYGTLLEYIVVKLKVVVGYNLNLVNNNEK